MHLKQEPARFLAKLIAVVPVPLPAVVPVALPAVVPVPLPATCQSKPALVVLILYCVVQVQWLASETEAC